MKKTNIYLSTIASDAAAMAREYGLGLEIAQYCTAWNMDREFPAVDEEVTHQLEGIRSSLLHGPFNELFPCAIDPKARELAADRYRQAIALAKRYGSQKVVLHGGYNPWIYYSPWYVEQSIVFWKEFLQEDPGVQIVLENVLETDPQWLLEIVEGVGDEMLKLCLDIGHVNAYSKIPLMEWLQTWEPFISHFHVHNNDGTRDQHSGLQEGTIAMQEFLLQAQQLCPNATVTLELLQDAPSLAWLRENGWI